MALHKAVQQWQTGYQVLTGLAPIVDFLKKELLKRDVIHCDETMVQVLKEPGLDYRNAPELMEDMMPWSERVQNECK